MILAYFMEKVTRALDLFFKDFLLLAIFIDFYITPDNSGNKFKVGGILTKSSSMGNSVKIQIGIGINTKTSECHEFLPDTIYALTGKFIDNLELSNEIRKVVDYHVHLFCVDGEKALKEFKLEYQNCWNPTVGCIIMKVF